MIKVAKFGGSSLASAEQFRKVSDIIHSDESRRYVVPSAPGRRFHGDSKVTDLLYTCYAAAESGDDFTDTLSEIESRYQEIIEGLNLSVDLSDEFRKIDENIRSQCGKDYAASRGEYLNGIVLAAYLGYEFVDAAQIIRFDDEGHFDPEATNRLVGERLAGTQRAVIPGFYGSKADGTIVAFSRGGSDITGSIIARGVSANVYENWTDVSGVMVADPRIIRNPEVIRTITYLELRELSYMGASVLHADAIFPVRQAGIPINIRNTNAPDDEGTWIVERTSRIPKYTITGIAGKKDFVAVNLAKDQMNSEVGFGRKVLTAFEEYGLSFEHMPSGIDTMTIVINQKDFQEKEQKVLTEITRLAHPDTIDLEPDIALIAIVGRCMKENRGTAARIFAALAHAKINVKMIDQGSSEMNIIIGVKNADFENAIRAIYDIFVTTQL
ncbi:MAG: aspartate kinase [Lachnospiraceae bacterium]|jgi:aspartate kinase